MIARGGELVTTNEPTIIAELFLDAIVVEDSQGDGSLANSAGTNESDWSEVFCEAGPRWWGWGFSGYARCKSEIMGAIFVEVPNLVCGWVMASVHLRMNHGASDAVTHQLIFAIGPPPDFSLGYCGYRKRWHGCPQHCDEAQKRWYGYSQRRAERRKRWCGCLKHHGGLPKRLRVYLSQARSMS